MKLILTFGVIWIFWDAVYRADIHTLGRVIMPHAFGAQAGIDDIDVIARTDCLVGADRFTDITVDTVGRDF